MSYGFLENFVFCTLLQKVQFILKMFVFLGIIIYKLDFSFHSGDSPMKFTLDQKKLCFSLNESINFASNVASIILIEERKAGFKNNFVRVLWNVRYHFQQYASGIYAG